ncbi:MAG: DNA sulfur modification protein DndD [Candidatus Electrothrix sp. AS4_5]|nr:DNA sulfur modification protein DndD [Candidatus Electrothrix gigas]
MIFEKITINNMFSYYGEAVFDFTGKTGPKNIVLISGRNGFGKTSFLNAIKLLFTGVTNELRSEVQRQKGKPSIKQYIIGSGDDWWGIFNRHAKNESTLCSVEIIWRENDKQVTTRRAWTVEDNTYDEQLTVQFLDKILENEEAQAFLDERLPEDYVPFFFFDGEKIQELASANIARTAEHIERLLNISHVNNLRDALKKAVSAWRRDGALDQTAEAELENAKNQYHNIDKNIQACLQEKQDIQDELEQLNRVIARLQERQESSRSFISQQEEFAVTSRIQEFEITKKQLVEKIGEDLPYDIILLANEKLLNKVRDELNMLLSDKVTENKSLIEELLEFLPDDLFDRPPQPSQRISEEQKDFYKKKLENRLKEYTEGQGTSEKKSLFTLNIADANMLQKCIQPYLDSRLLRMERKEKFKQLQQMKRELDQLNDKRSNIGSLSADEKFMYEQRKEELKKKEEDRNNWNYLLGEVDGKETRLLEKKKVLEADIKKKEQELELTRVARRKVDTAKKFQNFFNEYKDRLKRQRRAELEESVNQYFKQLMTSNELIQHIAIDGYFGIHYQDKDGVSIGMGNLSAGMKQLAATSLLWALKTCSGRPMPIVVDTPMARIDKGNQDNLLRHYYPAVSEQVILLPTDSELDERKYNLLKPYIYQEYVLENKSGTKSSPVQRTMYSD